MVNTGEEDLPGVNGGIFQPKELFIGTVNTIDVPDIDAYMERVKSSGGQVVTEKVEILEIGTLAYCQDVEGTLFGIIQLVVSPEQ